MSIAEELQKIEEMYAHGALTQEEFEQAKAKVLTGDEPRQLAADSQTARQIAQLQRQNAVAQLDREWESERVQYMLRGGYGSRSVPTESGSIFGTIFCVGIGIVWVILGFTLTSSLHSSRTPSAIFPVFGVFFVVFGIVSGINSYAKAGQYREAEQRYQQKRARLMAEPVEL